jgi:hypothetical protein
MPTPEREGGGRDNPDYTPLATPSYHYNSWANGRKKTGQTPVEGGAGKGGGGGGADSRGTIGKARGDEAVDPLQAERDKESWEEADKQLDRDWYDMEEGGFTHDEDSNPFMMDEVRLQAGPSRGLPAVSCGLIHRVCLCRPPSPSARLGGRGRARRARRRATGAPGCTRTATAGRRSARRLGHALPVI